MSKFFTLLASMAFLGLAAGSAQASTLNYYDSGSSLYATISIDNPSNAAGNIDFNSMSKVGYLNSITPAHTPLQVTNPAASGTLSTVFAGVTDRTRGRPAQNVGSNYLAVYSFFGASGTATFDFANDPTKVSFNVGSINLTNTFTFTDTKNNTFTLTGKQILVSALGSDLGVLLNNDGQLTKFITISDAFGISKIVMTAGWANLQVGNMSAVPLPAAVLLFGSALTGAGILRRKQKIAAK